MLRFALRLTDPAGVKRTILHRKIYWTTTSIMNLLTYLYKGRKTNAPLPEWAGQESSVRLGALSCPCWAYRGILQLCEQMAMR